MTFGPWWFVLAFIPILAVFLVLRGRYIKRLWDKVKRGGAGWDDDWDPFR